MRPRQNSLTHPRGRLPARVYWVRRGLVAVVAVALVFGFAQLFGSVGGSGGGGNDTARLAADQESTAATASASPSTPSFVFPTPRLTTPTTEGDPGEDLAVPDGPCSPDDLSVEPSVSHAYALQPVTIHLRLSGASPACTFKVTPKTVAVKITSGKDQVWSTQDCPQGIKKKTVVVRSGHDTKVSVNWGGHRSANGECSISNPWAEPGYYHVLAAVLGSTPADSQFKLTVGPREVITKTTHPHTKKHDKSGSKAGSQESQSTSGEDDASSGSGAADEGDKGGATGKGSACGGDNAASSC